MSRNKLSIRYENDIEFKGKNHMGKNKEGNKISLISIMFEIILIIIIGIFSFFASVNIAKKESTVVGFIWGYTSLGIIIIAAFTLQVIIHELGHMIFGLVTGYSFLSLRIGKFIWIKQDGKIRFHKLLHTGSGGQCLMVPPDIVNGKIPYVLYNLGGSILNMVTVIIFAILAIFVNKESLIFVLFVVSTLIGLTFILRNVIPVKELQNDGYDILEISRRPENLCYYWIQLKIYEKQMKGVRLKDMPDEWFEIPADKSMSSRITLVMWVLACYRMMDNMEFIQAEQIITKLMSMGTGLTTLHHNLMNIDLVYCYLVNNNGLEFIPEIMEIKLESFINKMKDDPSILRTKYAYALLWKKDYGKAEEVYSNFIKVAERYPYPARIEGEREKILYAKEVYDRTL